MKEKALQMGYYSPPFSRHRDFHAGDWAIGLIVAVAVIFLIIAAVNSYSAESTVIATVCSKEAVPNGNSGSEYRVYTSQGTFVVKDHIIDGTRFNSADVYGRLEPNETYVLTVYGWRLPFFSQFKNIASEQLAPSSEQHPKACV